MLGLPDAFWNAVTPGIMAFVGAVVGILLKAWLDDRRESNRAREAQTYPKAYEALNNLHMTLMEMYRPFETLSADKVDRITMDDAQDLGAKIDALTAANLRAELYLRDKGRIGISNAVQRAINTFLDAAAIIQYSLSVRLKAESERLQAEYQEGRTQYLAEAQEVIELWEHIVDLRQAIQEVEVEIGREIDIPPLPDELKDSPQLVAKLRRELQEEEELAQQQDEASSAPEANPEKREQLEDSYNHLKESFDWGDIRKHYVAAVDALAPLLSPKL